MTVVTIFGSSYGFTVNTDVSTTMSAVRDILEKEPGDFKVSDIGAGQVLIEPDEWRLDRRKLANDVQSALTAQFSEQSV